MGKVAMIKDFYLGIEVWINLAQHKVQVCFECFGVQFSILGVPPETLVKHLLLLGLMVKLSVASQAA